MDSINMFYNQQQQQQQPEQQGYTSLGNSMGSGLGLSLANASTRSNSPESQNSSNSTTEQNLLDMIVSNSNISQGGNIISLALENYYVLRLLLITFIIQIKKDTIDFSFTLQIIFKRVGLYYNLYF